MALPCGESIPDFASLNPGYGCHGRFKRQRAGPMPSTLTGFAAMHVPDARLFAIALAALACCIVWLGAAGWRHRQNLRAIAVRIHVAGTRGKSTTTRLIAAGLRAGGLRVVAKT